MSNMYPTKAGLGLHNGKFTNGNDASGVLPSVLDADHINLLTDNMQGAIQGAGLNPNNQDGDQLQKSLNWAAGIWQEGAKYLAGAQVLHTVSGSTNWHTATAPHTATAANAPGQQGAPWVRSDARTTALEATNIGKTGNQPLVKFTASDWKDRPIGWHGIIAPGSVGNPDARYVMYVEKVGNLNEHIGYYWRAYPYNDYSTFYLGHNQNPATLNGGLPFWRKYAPGLKTYSLFSGPTGRSTTMYMSRSLDEMEFVIIKSGSSVLDPESTKTWAAMCVIGTTVLDYFTIRQRYAVAGNDGAGPEINVFRVDDARRIWFGSNSVDNVVYRVVGYGY